MPNEAREGQQNVGGKVKASLVYEDNDLLTPASSGPSNKKSIMLPEKRAKKNYNDHHPGESAIHTRHIRADGA